MKNSLYIIAGLLVLLWAIVTFGFHSFRTIDILLPIAAFVVLLRILFYKKSQNNKNKN
jgi:tryptophan-rich sensory protein